MHTIKTRKQNKKIKIKKQTNKKKKKKKQTKKKKKKKKKKKQQLKTADVSSVLEKTC